MKTTSPIIHEGKEYNQYAVSLATNVICMNGDYTTGVNFRLTPMRKDEESGEMELLHSHAKVLLYSDIRNQGDTDELIAFGKIEAAIQELVTKRNW